MKTKNVSQAAAEVDQAFRGRPAGPAVRAESLGVGQEGAEEAQGDFKGQGTITPAPSASASFRKMKRMWKLRDLIRQEESKLT